ncbi:siderochrome-iron transporter [Grosmannia clavigera kw1407]|uniref:Siderochrome-iron transporter n=1 Tax=Grosmannia clavigera (strain kw1407 / UAMH 11150) TaxID=655863 RepID=F0XBM1_GROCL|nr:siderochrome-iron transporter [Grosmannia clavigera kw1407]EFX05040.1 siderochrome-iron transporter [Grosmannia clavigera kw1407]
MGVFSNIRGRDQAIDDMVLAREAGSGTLGDETKAGDLGESASDTDPVEKNEREVRAHGNSVTTDAQLGVQKAEAAALVWPRWAMYGTYGWIWVCFFMLALQQSILSNVTYYAYSAFSTAPQLATANILASIIGGVLKLPIAKVLNIWGRCEGFLVFLAIYLLGMIVLASSSGPNSYAAGYTLYWIGYDALYFIMDVFVADTSGLRNRAFAFAFASTPFICTAFTGPRAAQSFLEHSTWRWAIGSFCIIQVFVFAPLGCVFKYFEIRARKAGLWVPRPSGRSRLQSLVHYFHEFDIIGAFLLMAAWVLFLLPFSLESNGRTGYRTATFIVMIILGVLLFFVFAAWERFLAPTHFVRWELFKQRTVLGACVMAAVLYYSFYSWDLYYYYFIEVVYNLDVSDTGYMTQIYNVGSCFWGPVFGLFVRQTRHFKYGALVVGLGLLMLGSGLMIRFRGQDSNIGFIIMCQIFIAFGGGTLVIANSMAVMAAADRDGVPLLLALLALCNSLGGAVGTAVCNAINSNTFVDALRERIDNETLVQALYNGGATYQMTYLPGDPIREATNYAWGWSQKWNCVSSTAILVLGIPAIMVWKNYSVDKKQNKGNVI